MNNLYIIFDKETKKEILLKGKENQKNIEDLIHLIQLEDEKEITITELKTVLKNVTELETTENRTNLNWYDAVYFFDLKKMKKEQKYLKDLYRNPFIFNNKNDRHEKVMECINNIGKNNKTLK